MSVTTVVGDFEIAVCFQQFNHHHPWTSSRDVKARPLKQDMAGFVARDRRDKSKREVFLMLLVWVLVLVLDSLDLDISAGFSLEDDSNKAVVSSVSFWFVSTGSTGLGFEHFKATGLGFEHFKGVSSMANAWLLAWFGT